MYLPAAHREDDTGAQHALIRACPLGLLISNGPGGLMANSAPFLLRTTASKPATLGVHMARANPQWREIAAAGEALVVFQDADAYVTPSWYATKRENGKVVPTWNYASVHVWGRARVMDDRAWIRQQVGDLTAEHETGRAQPWQMSDAPDEYIDRMLEMIIGVEIEITRIEGKWKMSQNRTPVDREGVIAGLRAHGGDAELRVANLTQAATRNKS